MNQILQVNNKKKHNELKHKKDIILFLTIILVVVCVGVGTYLLLKNADIKFTAFPVFSKQTTQITLTKKDRNNLIINVESKIGISKITYDINGEQSQVIELTGEKFIEETIEMPVAENVVYVSVIDLNGKETTKKETFMVDLPKPVIELAIVGNDIKVIVTSEIELSEIVCRWNSENEKRYNMATYENRLLFEKQLEIPIGQNSLTIVATDTNGETVEKVQVIKGVTKATTTTEVIGGYWHFTVKGKENIETVQFEFNGQKFLMNKETFGETKRVHYKVKLVEGNNYLIITSTTQSGGIDTTTWEEEYN